MLLAAKISLFGNIILFTLKIIALCKVNSLAIATDLGVTVVGLVVSLILYYSVNLSSKPADFLHNYGYGKIEHVCEALEGVVLIGIALAMSFQAIIHFFHTSEMAAPWLGFGFSVVGSTINFIGAAWILKIGKTCNSPAVHAEGVHYKLEGFISLTVAGAFLAAVFLEHTPLGFITPYLDPAATLAVSFLIAIPSFNLAKHAFVKLLDSSIEEDGKIEILAQLGKYIDQCCEFRDLRSRSSGREKFVELKLVLPPAMSFVAAHELSTRVAKDLEENIRHCSATVTTVPCTENCVSHAVVYPEKLT